MSEPNAPGGDATDESLLEAALMGSVPAFERLVERHYGLVYVIGFGHLRSREAAEDLAQEVFLRVFLHLSSLDRRSAFTAWVSRIARNLALDWLRRGRAASRLGVQLPLDSLADHEMPASPSPGARERMEEDERDRVLREAVFGLPPDQRELVLLLTVEGLSQQEIASRLGVHQGTVSRQIRKAKVALRGSIDPILAETARSWRPPTRAVARTLGAVGAVAVLSGEAKSAMAAATGLGNLSASGASATGSVSVLWGLLQSAGAAAWAWLTGGGIAMAGGKAVAAVVVAGCVVAGGWYYRAESRERVDPAKQAVRNKINGQIAASLPPATDGARLAVPKAQFGAHRGSISPDGRYIVYNRNPEDGPWQVWLYSTVDHKQREIAPAIQESKCGPSFSPDGQRILFTTLESGVYVYDIASARAVLLIKSRGIVVADWSLDGKYITYTVSEGKYPDNSSFLVIYDVTQAKTVKEVRAPEAWIAESCLSPDNRFVAYRYQVKRTSETKLAIESIETGERRILELPHNAQTPKYSPDGKYIAYRGDDRQKYRGHGGSEIYLLDLVTSETRQLTHGNGVLPSWRGDSKAIVFTSERDGGESQIYEIDLAPVSRK